MADHKLREALEDIGRRRATLAHDRSALAAETAKTVRRARRKMTVAEIAQLTGLSHQGVYTMLADDRAHHAHTRAPQRTETLTRAHGARRDVP